MIFKKSLGIEFLCLSIRIKTLILFDTNNVFNLSIEVFHFASRLLTSSEIGQYLFHLLNLDLLYLQNNTGTRQDTSDIRHGVTANLRIVCHPSFQDILLKSFGPLVTVVAVPSTLYCRLWRSYRPFLRSSYHRRVCF